MTQPELVLDLSVDGLSLWQPAEASEWGLLGFSSLDDPDLADKLAAMRQAAITAAGPGFGTMLLLPDDHIWVQRLHLLGLTAQAKDESARKVLAEVTSLPKAGFSIAYGDTDANGATAVAATTTDVLDEARTFARDNGFNPQLLASRSFFDGFSTRAIFGDAPKPTAILPRKSETAAQIARAIAAVEPKFAWPRIRREWALGGAAVALAVAAVVYWAIDPYEQFIRPPRTVIAVVQPAIPADVSVSNAPFAPSAGITSRAMPALPSGEFPVAVNLRASNAGSAGSTQVAVAFDAAGVYFAEVPVPPNVPAGLGAALRWTAPAAMFLDSPDDEPTLGVAVMQQLPVLAISAETPVSSGFLDDVLLSSVSTRSVSRLAGDPAEIGLNLPSADLLSEFAYRNGSGVLGAAVSFDLAPSLSAGIGAEISPLPLETLQLAALSLPLAINDSADILMATPQAPRSAPGLRPMARPETFAIIRPSEAAAALTPASEAPFIGPALSGPPTMRLPDPVTVFAPGAPGHVQPVPRPANSVLAPATGLADPSVFGPEWQPQIADLAVGATEFDTKSPAHIRPSPRSPQLVAKIAADAAQASILALNLPANATLDVGLGWEEYNPDNPVHTRPKVRPSSLQQLAEAGDLAPTPLAVQTSARPSARPSTIDAIILARSDELDAAQAAAAEAEARAQSVAEATALAIADALPQTSTSSEVDPDLAALADAEPESDVQVASLPTSASVADAATTDGDLNRNEINLIGIYGNESSRRALMRLPSGRYERVTVGDTFSGWKVAAISKDAIKLVKGGKEAVLRMPD